MDMADDYPAPSTWSPRTALLLVYPGFTALDLFGPQFFLAAVPEMVPQIVARTRDPVSGDAGTTVVPDHTIADAPDDCEVLLIPGGGQGTVAAMGDPRILAFVRAQAARARIVASVCTGSLILGAAGLLRGRRATSHWLVRDAVLPRLGAIPVASRVVEDGADLITAAGVTAGLDLGLALVRRLAGEDYARKIALLAEYPGEASQVSGPELGTPQAAEALKAMFGPMLAHACEIADLAAAKFNPSLQATETGTVRDDR
jgi:cyclohexyl-isocyanide hydratase